MQGAGLVNVDRYRISIIAAVQHGILIDGNIVQGRIEDLIRLAVRISYIVDRVDVLSSNRLSDTVLYSHPDIAGHVGHPAIDRGASAGEAVRILGCAIGGVHLQAGAVAVAQVVQVNSVGAVGAVGGGAHKAGLLIAGEAGAFCCEFRLIGLGRHQLAVLGPEVLLIVHGGGRNYRQGTGDGGGL